MYPIDVPEDQKTYFQELLPAMRHIEKRFRERISMERLAEQTGISSTHFNRRFQTLLRMSPTQYVAALRIQEARRLLRGTPQSVAAIAAEIGFYDQSHFTKVFHRATGLPPLAYRKRFR